MKIAIQVNNTSEPAVGDYEVIDFNDLQNIHDASCEEIFIGDCLDYFERREDTTNYILSKIRYGGKGTITGVDLLTICSLRKSFKISDQQAKDFIYSQRKSVSSMIECLKHLKSMGMKIDSKRLDGAKYCINFRRPKVDED
tara:strand:+ start:59 stop:481 length:423 start_codon:yes stop_codon:yes gene_type:complete